MKSCKYWLVIVFMFELFQIKAQFLAKARIDHLELNTYDTIGNFYITVVGGTGPKTYTWNPGGLSSKDYTNAASGSYTLDIVDSVGSALKYYYNLGYKTNWINFYGSIFRNDTLMPNNVCCMVTRTALSKNTLLDSTDGWIQHIVADYDTPYAIGFLDSAYSTPWIYDVDFAAHETTGSNLYAWSSGYFTWVGTARPGDVLIIERVGSQFNLKKNDTILHTDAALLGKKLKCKAISEGCSLGNIGVSFNDTSSIERLHKIIPVIDHLVNDGIDSLGNINITVYGGSTPYSYTWTPGPITTKDLSNVPLGSYTLNIKDNDNDSLIKRYEIGYKTDWINFYGTKFRNDTVMSDGSSVSGPRTCVTKNTLPANTDGWFQYVVPDYSDSYLIGFLDSNSVITPSTIYDVDFALHLTGGNYFYAWAGASWNYLGNAYGGDIIKVERKDTVYNMYLNGVVSFTYAAPAHRKLKVKYATTDNSIAYLGVSFNDTTSIDRLSRVIAKVDHLRPDGVDSLGNISITYKDGLAPFNYLWSPGSITTKNITDVPLGTYTFKIKDANNDSIIRVYDLGYKTKWTNTYGSISRNDSILIGTPASPSGNNTAVSINTLKANVNGWFEYVIKEIEGQNTIGFTDSLSVLRGTDSDIDYGVVFYGQYLYSFTNGTISYLTEYSIGDVLKVERIDSLIRYELNGSIINTITCNPSNDWKIKASLTSGCFTNLGCSFYDSTSLQFPNYILFDYDKSHTVWSSNSGSIKIYPTSGSLSYDWLPLHETNSYITGKDIGTYSVSLVDSNSNSSNQSFDIGYKIEWDSLYNAEVNGDSLIDIDYGWATALSENSVVGEKKIWFDCRIDSKDNDFAIGILDTLLYSTDPSDIAFGFYFQGGTQALYQINYGSYTFLWYADKGDYLTVERDSGNVYYKLNNQQISSGTYTPDTLNKSWRIKAMLSGLGSRVVGPGINLPIRGNKQYAKLFKKLDGSFYTTNGIKFYFTLDGEYSNDNLIYNVYNYQRVSVSTPISNTGLNNGDNRYELNIASLSTGYYVLEVQNQKKEKLYLRFKK